MYRQILINLALKIILASAKVNLGPFVRQIDIDNSLPIDDGNGNNSNNIPLITEPSSNDSDIGIDPVTEEMFSSWALFIVISLLISALWSGYYLNQRHITAVHETVLSIFYGMITGLIIRVSPGHVIQNSVSFNSAYFFNILLPPIILNSGYELNQTNFFNNIVSILTFAIPGTFISAVVLGIIVFVWTSLGLESVNISFADAMSLGATLSATDPVTILSIFNTYKVDPKLYTIIFGESLLNDAISIVMFETCQQLRGTPATLSSILHGIGLFLLTFGVSLLIGCAIGILVALVLKHSLIRRYPQIESCLILLIAYQSYFFSNGCHMSGIVSLLFCGITLKHYAYYNMSRRTQLTVKYIFQLLARLSENFIFIYLGLELFTEVELVYKPLLIIVTAVSIVVARWCAVFPLSRFINWMYRSRYLRLGGYNVSSVVDNSNGEEGSGDGNLEKEIPDNYRMMTFWAGLRGAVGVALALGIKGEYKFTLLATVLVVVVLSVIVFGGTTSGMLEVLDIKTGCVDTNDESDDEFDIEAVQAVPTQQRTPSTRFPTYSDEHRSANTKNLITDDDILTGSGGMIDIPDDGVSIPEQEAPPGRQSDGQNIRGTLGDLLRSDSQWFSTLDENLLKPVLLDSSAQRSTKRSGTPSVGRG